MNQGGGKQAVEEAPPPRMAREPEAPPEDDEGALPEIAGSGLLYQPSPVTDEERLGGVNEEVAVSRVVTYVRDAAELDPTLVVWLMDRSYSASRIAFQASRRINQFYTDIGKGRIPGIRPRAETPRLLTAIVSFGQDVQFPLEKPTGDARTVMQAIDAIPVDSDPREMTFTALSAAVEKYLPYRTEQGRRLLLVVVTDEAGDDAERGDEVLAALRKYGAPVYVIGAPAPFGQISALPNVGEGETPPSAPAGDSRKPSGPALRHGPESQRLERVNLPSFASFWRNQVLESGFGPFALERLCRATGGEFISLQPPAEDAPGASLADWPSSRAVRFDQETMRRYLPDYVSAEAYQQRLQENAAKMALHQASQLEDFPGPYYPDLEFPREIESAMQRRVARAQQLAARLAPQVDRVYALLQQGEADRARLTEPRWRAGFDLALGRAAAAKARIDGYSAALAMLKRSRRFENPESTRWVLQGSDTTEAGTTIERLMAKARTHLERVVNEHPGTPWAHLAQEELDAKFGWQWVEQ